MSEILGSGLAFPLGVDASGALALASNETDVEQAIQLIMDTAPGERPMRPDFGCGVHDFVFERIDAQTTSRIEAAVRAALDRWEPRIAVESIEFETEEQDGGLVLQIELYYRIRATNTERNLVYPFYVIPDEETTP